MKRFIDLRQHEEDIQARFAFFDTVNSEFEMHSGSMTWNTLRDFANDHEGGSELFDRYYKLTPDWAKELAND